MRQPPGTFTISHASGAARRGVLHTAHGALDTPAFMPVGTQATVKSLGPDDIAATGAQIILGNTYHLRLRPGDELIARRGGLHTFMAWDRPILTDSGGFQVFSLSGLRKLTPDGVEFASHIDGSRHFFSPESVIAIQRNLGSDVMMVLDECPPYGADAAYTEKSLELTTAWAKRSRLAYPKDAGDQLVFGIVQGGFFPELRARSAHEICSIDFDGIAVGGLSVGESTEKMYDILTGVAPLLPQGKPHYLMGVGKPQDIVTAIGLGVDMFDCVLPTRNARNGTLFTWNGQCNIKKSENKEDDAPIDPNCPCYACTTFSRAYLRHLYMAKELLAYRLNTLHNLTFYQQLMSRARTAIEQNRYAAFAAAVLPALRREEGE
ncbi:MAG: tRNA guanosine(34) transglycosylase Tgt [Desulfovibrionaceae bacterium]|nr:tRNA guanosine(34) transglycosylase Tgt [Desulfovibrionaceae bacterium]MBF0512728.1 tRNA guanosine(34) transglycosylase Tgt [Desulfovibrionaceae bacterium]